MNFFYEAMMFWVVYYIWGPVLNVLNPTLIYVTVKGSGIQWNLDLQKPHYLKISEYKTGFVIVLSHLTKGY